MMIHMIVPLIETIVSIRYFWHSFGSTLSYELIVYESSKKTK